MSERSSTEGPAARQGRPLTGHPNRWRDLVYVAVNTDPTTAEQADPAPGPAGRSASAGTSRTCSPTCSPVARPSEGADCRWTSIRRPSRSVSSPWRRRRDDQTGQRDQACRDRGDRDDDPEAHAGLPQLLGDDPTWYKDAIIYELHVKAFYDSTATASATSAG